MINFYEVNETQQMIEHDAKELADLIQNVML